MASAPICLSFEFRNCPTRGLGGSRDVKEERVRSLPHQEVLLGGGVRNLRRFLKRMRKTGIYMEKMAILASHLIIPRNYVDT